MIQQIKLTPFHKERNGVGTNTIILIWPVTSGCRVPSRLFKPYCNDVKGIAVQVV